MREIRRIDPISVFKLGLVVYLLLGFLFSVLILLFGSNVVGSVPFASRFGQWSVGVMGVVLGTVIYGLLGGASWALGALVYNLIVKKLGGIKVELL